MSALLRLRQWSVGEVHEFFHAYGHPRGAMHRLASQPQEREYQPPPRRSQLSLSPSFLHFFVNDPCAASRLAVSDVDMCLWYASQIENQTFVPDHRDSSAASQSTPIVCQSYSPKSSCSTIVFHFSQRIALTTQSWFRQQSEGWHTG